MWTVLKNHKVAYALAWRNAGTKKNGSIEFYAPYKGQLSEKNFIAFCDNEKIWLQQDAAKENLYQQKK